MSQHIESPHDGNYEDEKKECEVEGRFSLSEVIDSFLHRVLDIEECARQFIPMASDSFNENADRLKNELNACQKLLEEETDHDKRLIGARNIRRCIREIDRHNNSAPMQVLEKSLFISLFSSFDKYLGDLIAALYARNPELYRNLNRELALSEVLKYESIEELRDVVLEKEIETIRRKSYMEQFSDLEKRFSLKLTKFDGWPRFIEASQRRNLFTHCDGVISKQYLDVCRSVNYRSDKKYRIGDQLGLGAGYFFGICHLLTEVAVMLGQTLWRKVEPSSIEQADGNLSSLIFDYLHMESWAKAISLSKFALGLPNISDDQMERIFTVNYAIALNAMGNNQAAKNVLDKKDWTATSYDFRLAYSVVCGDFEKSGELMRRLGREGELITEMAYHDWPLFREFRDCPEFFDGYEQVYGYKYSTKLTDLADEKRAEAVNEYEVEGAECCDNDERHRY